MAPTTITLYSTVRCPYSRDVRDYLQQKSVEFVETDADTEAGSSSLWQATGGHDVPTVVVHQPAQASRVVIGFDRDKLDAVLELL